MTLSIFPVPDTQAADLRRLFSAPERLFARLPAETLKRVLDLARFLSGSETVGVRLLGGKPVGDLAMDDVEVGALDTREGGPVLLSLDVPLLSSGVGSTRPFGVLGLAAPRDDADLPRLARHAASTLIAAAITHLIETDRLTGLLARGALECALPPLTQKISAETPLSALMIDVDGLRALNATRGLKSGDELLKVLGVLATGAAGTEGVVCRYGGDELVLLLPRGAEEASRVATGFADSVRQLVGFGEPGPSVSIGIATAPEHAETADELVFRADQALAEAKTLGRGQHAVWSPALRNQRRGDRLAGVLTGRQARDYRHVNALLDTVSAVSRLAPLDEILTEVVDRCRAIAGAERGLLLLKDGERWAVRVARGPNGVELSNPPFAASIAEEALTSGVTVSRLAGDDSISPSAETLGLNAVLCAPLQGDDVPHGVIYVDTTSRREPFERATLAFFDALTAQVLTALRNASLYERLLQRAKGLSGDVAGREQELVRLRSLWERDRQTPRESPVEGLIGSSPPMQEVFRLLQSLKGTSVSVVVEGESGTGKELVSRAIHEVSGRAGPLITVNCGAIVATLFESELFGHVQGSFTGALGDRVGLLEAANGGTLFLDEIGELPLESQAKLLRALQEGEIRRLGDSTARSIDVRIVAATNRDLLAMVEDGEFREDLFYRLAVFRLRIPPLRERVTDIPEIVSHLLSESQAKPDARTPAVSPAAMRALSRNPWPGNVRQLRNVLDRALVLAQDGVLLPEHVETPSGGEQRGARDMSALLLLPLKQAKAAFSAVYAQTAIDRAGGSVPEAAKAAGVTRQTLYRILADKQS